jgi:hypothetical protein
MNNNTCEIKLCNKPIYRRLVIESVNPDNYSDRKLIVDKYLCVYHYEVVCSI